jgi:hypothetical protein
MKSDVWLTPPAILKALGPFDLDPCAPLDRPWDMARHHFTAKENGLSRRWEGRVWMNPPYGAETSKWLRRLVEHGNGIALIFARTETQDWVRHVWGSAAGVLFIAGRLHFHYPDGRRAEANSGAPSALIAYGQENVSSLATSGIAGSLVAGWRAVGVSQNTQAE